MRILIDIGHPAHVHLFRPFAIEMQKKGAVILFTFREKEFEKELLDEFGFLNVCIGKHYKHKLRKLFGLLEFNLRLLKVAIGFRPDIFLSHGSMYAAQVSFLIRKPHISLEDSGNMEQIHFYRPFTKAILTPDVLSVDLGLKQIKYKSFHELAYLSPKYFTPDRNILSKLDLKKNEKYAFIRFVYWSATHDRGQVGLSLLQKEEIIEYLDSKMKVFISSEGEVPTSMKKYLISVKPHQIHNVIAFAQIVISEGATMASEAGVLGIPSIYVNSQVRCYNEEQANYNTVYNFRNGTGVLNKVKEIVGASKSKELAEKGRQELLSNKINLTELLIWFVENFPCSFRTLNENPNYQDRFKINFCE